MNNIVDFTKIAIFISVNDKIQEKKPKVLVKCKLLTLYRIIIGMPGTEDKCETKC